MTTLCEPSAGGGYPAAVTNSTSRCAGRPPPSYTFREPSDFPGPAAPSVTSFPTGSMMRRSREVTFRWASAGRRNTVDDVQRAACVSGTGKGGKQKRLEYIEVFATRRTAVSARCQSESEELLFAAPSIMLPG